MYACAVYICVYGDGIHRTFHCTFHCTLHCTFHCTLHCTLHCTFHYKQLLEAKMASVEFVGELTQQLGLPPQNLLLHLEGDMSSGVEGNALAPTVQHTGSSSTQVVIGSIR